eukprot:4463066-Amphidinium_carterae.1
MVWRSKVQNRRSAWMSCIRQNVEQYRAWLLRAETVEFYQGFERSPRIGSKTPHADQSQPARQDLDMVNAVTCGDQVTLAF